MECSEFEAILQDRLDRRLPLPLGDDARTHLRQCFACEQDYQFFQQLARLTQNPTPKARIETTPPETTADPNLDQVIGRCVAALGPELETEHFTDGPVDQDGWERWPDESVALPGHPPTTDDGIPLAPWVSLPDQNGLDNRSSNLGNSNLGNSNPRRSADRLAALAAVVSAALLLVAVGWLAWSLTPTPPQLTGQATESSDATTEAAGAVTGPEGLAATPLASENLRDIAKNWDDSVVAFDRSWQQMAAGRVRAHQIPGMQPAVYPITGAVEAFRKNWIRRNPDGLAAGLQW